MISFVQVKMRILMGTYALSAGYYDAYYKRAQQVNGHNNLKLERFLLEFIYLKMNETKAAQNGK